MENAFLLSLDPLESSWASRSKYSLFSMPALPLVLPAPP